MRSAEASSTSMITAAREVPPLFRQADAHTLAGQAERDKHGPAVFQPSQGVAAIGQRCECYVQSCDSLTRDP